MEHLDPLLDCLIELTRIFARPTTRSALVAGLPVGKDGLTPSLFHRAASRAGLATKVVKIPLADIHEALLPAVLILKDNRACVLLKVDVTKKVASVLYPETGQGAVSISIENLEAQYTERTIFARPRFRLDNRTPEAANVVERHWFWSAFIDQMPLYKDVLVAAFLINVFATIIPFFSMNVYDRVIPSKAEETLWMLALGVVVVVGLDYFLKMVRSHFVDLAGSRIDVKLSALIMEKVMGMKLVDKPLSVGSFAQTLRSFESVRDFMSSATVTTLVDLPFAILFLILIGWISWPLIFIPIVATLVIIIYSLHIKRQVHALTEQTYRTTALRNSTLIESLSALETLKSLGAENYIQTRWESISTQLAKISSSVRHKNHSATGLVSSMSSFCIVANVVLGVYLIDLKMLTMGGLIASGMFISRIIAPLAQTVGLIMQYENAKMSLGMLEEQMKKPGERSEQMSFVHRDHIKGDIELRDVKFTYPNQESLALNGVSFKIKQGEHVAIIGKTGSGKTTLTRLIMGMYQPIEGAVRVDGIDLRQLDPADLRSHIGCVEQHTVLFFGTLRENITLGAPHAEDNQILHAADVGMLSDIVNRHPRGFDMMVGERGEFLSGGQRQCVAIARAALMSPSILLFDEPTSAMDFSTESMFIKKMETYSEDKTMVIVTHRMSLLALAKRVIVMDQGRVVADGPKESVLEALNSGKLGVAS
ncbi:SunT ABC-type bacteriocin/lantibiotic exporters, contain an N-terminal double-glycine peptidase domain [Methylophilaceae bacterium]